MNFGEKIKQLRIEMNWTQEYVADKLNISMGALSRYETGMYEPKSLDLIKDFAILYNVSTDYLLGKSDKRNSTEINYDPDLLTIGLSTKDYEISEEKKQQIEEFAKYVLKDNKKDKENK